MGDESEPAGLACRAARSGETLFETTACNLADRTPSSALAPGSSRVVLKRKSRFSVDSRRYGALVRFSSSADSDRISVFPAVRFLLRDPSGLVPTSRQLTG